VAQGVIDGRTGEARSWSHEAAFLGGLVCLERVQEDGTQRWPKFAQGNQGGLARPALALSKTVRSASIECACDTSDGEDDFFLRAASGARDLLVERRCQGVVGTREWSGARHGGMAAWSSAAVSIANETWWCRGRGLPSGRPNPGWQGTWVRSEYDRKG